MVSVYQSCCCHLAVAVLSSFCHCLVHLFTSRSHRVERCFTFYIILISFHFCYAGCKNIEIMLLMCIILASHLFSWMHFFFSSCTGFFVVAPGFQVAPSPTSRVWYCFCRPFVAHLSAYRAIFVISRIVLLCSPFRGSLLPFAHSICSSPFCWCVNMQKMATYTYFHSKQNAQTIYFVVQDTNFIRLTLHSQAVGPREMLAICYKKLSLHFLCVHTCSVYIVNVCTVVFFLRQLIV